MSQGLILTHVKELTDRGTNKYFDVSRGWQQFGNFGALNAQLFLPAAPMLNFGAEWEVKEPQSSILKSPVVLQ